MRNEELWFYYKLKICKWLTKGVQNGEKISTLLHINRLKENKLAKQLLVKSREKYLKRSQIKWLICLIGMVIAGFIGIEFPKIHKLLNSAIYQRGLLEEYFAGVIGDKNIS